MNTKQTKNTYVEELNGYVPTFITTCSCGHENVWMTSGVMIFSITCKNCNIVNPINWDLI